MGRPSESVEEDISRLALDSPNQPPDGEKRPGPSSGTRVTNPASASASSNRTRGHRRSSSHRGLTSAFQQLQVSEAGTESPEPQSQRPAADLPQWGLQSGQPSYQAAFPDPYGGQYRLPTGQFSTMQWMPVHPAMGYSMYGDARPSMYFDPRLQNMPFRPGFPPMPPVMQGPFPGMADPRFHMMPMNYFQASSQAPPVRHQPPRSPRLPADLSQSYDFDVEEVEKSPESCRKTLMLRNIPNKYSIHMLLEMLDKANRSPADELIYDFCYLPIDFKNRCNLGYAFVNFVDAGSTLECYKAFHGKRWNDFNSKKVCEVKYGRVQGREALIEHFKNSKFPSNDIDSLPLLFERIQNGDGSFAIQSVPLHSRQTAVQTQEL